MQIAMRDTAILESKTKNKQSHNHLKHSIFNIDRTWINWNEIPDLKNSTYASDEV